MDDYTRQLAEEYIQNPNGAQEEQYWLNQINAHEYEAAYEPELEKLSKETRDLAD